MNTAIKAALATILFALSIVLGLLAVVASVVLRAAPIIIAVVVCVWVLTGCTTNVTIDNSVIDQSDVTQVLGCGYEVYDETID